MAEKEQGYIRILREPGRVTADGTFGHHVCQLTFPPDIQLSFDFGALARDRSKNGLLRGTIPRLEGALNLGNAAIRSGAIEVDSLTINNEEQFYLVLSGLIQGPIAHYTEQEKIYSFLGQNTGLGSNCRNFTQDLMASARQTLRTTGYVPKEQYALATSLKNDPSLLPDILYDLSQKRLMNSGFESDHPTYTPQTGFIRTFAEAGSLGHSHYMTEFVFPETDGRRRNYSFALPSLYTDFNCNIGDTPLHKNRRQVAVEMFHSPEEAYAGMAAILPIIESSLHQTNGLLNTPSRDYSRALMDAASNSINIMREPTTSAVSLPESQRSVAHHLQQDPALLEQRLAAYTLLSYAQRDYKLNSIPTRVNEVRAQAGTQLIELDNGKIVLSSLTAAPKIQSVEPDAKLTNNPHYYGLLYKQSEIESPMPVK